ncbi:tRNA pseudouridine13 synthase [Natronospira proteinivora]|uniref:tRNA pseudouridine synthase D n=1 Tax=Natronospira proteinivora TaxID=1807133 RepID=A0ABT1G5S3_9GAMM|nr:tRNA pseudouridine(13) synthase TruD [Natronospira proteinivora]MCP1726643.1 tRNA pseudouridine13 synthase [Natronospira proteinivora]
MSVEEASQQPPVFEDSKLPHAHGGPLGSGRIRVSQSDFRVEEQLSFEPDGEGGHCFLYVEKWGANTPWVAGQLARLAGVGKGDVGYAGLKDRHAVTRQWFSVPAGDQDPMSWSLEDARVLKVVRHRKKLRTGSLSGNHFSLVVRDVEAGEDELDRRLAVVASLGVPNYYGPQRFGRDGDNVCRLLNGKLPRRNPLRGILLSAGRSWLFNTILAERVEADTWCRPVPGDLMILDGSRSHFQAASDDTALADRCRRGDVHPSGALWGEGDSPAGEVVAQLENAVASRWPAVVAKLETARMKQDRRPLRLPVRELQWTRDGEALRLRFFLPAGGFATTVLREIFDIEEAEHD